MICFYCQSLDKRRSKIEINEIENQQHQGGEPDMVKVNSGPTKALLLDSMNHISGGRSL